MTSGKKSSRRGEKKGGVSLPLTKCFKVKVLWLTIFLAVSVAAAGMAQEELLPDGAYGTTIHGGIKAGERKAYFLDGLAGQGFKANLATRGIEKGATLELLDSDGDSVLGGLGKLTKVDALNLVLPKKDRYKLFVKAGAMGCSYVLEGTLEDGDDEEAGRPVKAGRP